ncbi:heavy metal translocating P-type ATPase [Aliikangiella sp. G2MR2-5]|uniref:heavy metal translocating P-type ATPase n=1 Tax=Aliikangiella sp. G2MR2-5 TaxID=2788943 RepID=UPI0018A9A72C|nr:heavy metal translocating P-type ATPase [Aliikangiella sp. G2MR2-5]
MTSTHCYHCALPTPAGDQFQYQVLGQQRNFCCPGCLAVAQTICESGQQDFYRFRSTNNSKIEEILPEELEQLKALDTPEIQSEVAESIGDQLKIVLGVEGITCAACGWLIKKQLGKLEGITSVEVNVSTRRATILYEKSTSLTMILTTLRKLGYRAFPYRDDLEEESAQKEERAYIRRLIVAGLATMQVMMFATGLYLGDYQDMAKSHAYFMHWVSGFLATPVVFYSASPFLKSAWKNLKFRQLGMNLPVSIAILAAYSSSVFSLLTDGKVYYFDSVVMFTFFLLLGRYFEHKARLTSLLKQQNFRRLIPLSVTRISNKGKKDSVPIKKIKPNDKVLVTSGAIIPVDGKLITSKASLNESVITGESFPVEKESGQTVYSGSTNAGGAIEIRVVKPLAESRLQQLVDLQQSSENISSDRVSMADKIASWYVAILFLIVIIAVYYWYHLLAQPEMVFPVVLSLLVVSCPCALSLATPAAIASATATMTDLGLMVRKKNTLSRLAEVERVIFDKTGTLTLGKYRIEKNHIFAKLSKDEVKLIACSMERISNHPVAQAFKLSSDLQPLEFDQIEEVIAGGIKANKKETEYLLGSKKFVLAEITSEQAIQFESQTSALQSSSHSSSTSYLLKNGKLIAAFELEDILNTSAKMAIDSLDKSGISQELLSGDAELTCRTLANQLNIKTTISQASPEDKLHHIEVLKNQRVKTLMVGDGVNDIGALKTSYVSVTMGGASHLSQTASDAVLISQDLNVLPTAIKLSKKLNKIIKQNLSWAVIYNLTAIPFAFAGMIPAWLAAIGMTSSSLIVVLNALRLRKM